MSRWVEQIENVPEGILRRYFTPDLPLGPLNAGLVSKEHPAVTELLSERDLVPLRRAVERPSIVIGRRGSGKTSYLRKLSLNTPGHLFLELRTDRTLNLILGVVHNVIRDGVTVETVAEVWDAILWDCLLWLLNRTGRPRVGRAETVTHLKSIGIDLSGSIDSAIGTLSRNIQQVARENSGFALERTASYLRGRHFEELKEYAISELSREDTWALIVLDSLDEHPIRVEDFRKALSGLLKCAGEFNATLRNVDLRLCIPSELYWSFIEDVSTNPQKDFSSKLVVHWRVADLLVAVCRRMLIHLKLQHQRAYRLVKNNPLETRADADAFLLALFPSHIRNAAGRHERIDLYLLRHTQLLPRQLILILTEILRINTVDDGFVPGTSPFINETAVKLGVQEAETTIVDEIFSAYRDRFADTPKQACLAILPSLPRVFRNDELNRAIKDYGEQHGRTIPPALIRNMLLEVGVLGKLEREDSTYAYGKFEYTMTSRIAVGVQDRLCVHPLFSRVFDSLSTEEDSPIFPSAADL